MTEKPLDKFRRVLDEIFMFDHADLDFGIYRILNAKRDEIRRFLHDDLASAVRTTLAELESSEVRELKAKLEKTVALVRELGENPESHPKVKELRAQLVEAGGTGEAEAEVFSHLAEFFRRYYDDGDFVSMRRYKKDVYAIPYEGEEVKLHWANADQYYIKTSENFRDYTFKLDDELRVQLKLVEADTERDNNKASGDRRFVLAGENPVTVAGDTAIIRFEYVPIAEEKKQADLNVESAKAILDALPKDFKLPLGKALSEKDERTLLDKHLASYTARNTCDYFIHKDLGGFLRRELDFYIKNEVVHLDDIESETAPRVEQYLGKVRAIRRIGEKIITLLAQLEDFQKKLWLKKKFVVETQYCITLDRIPKELYPEIAANQPQHDEWVELFKIDEIKKDLGREGYSKKLSVKFLEENPFLVVDTKHFGEEFKRKVLGSLNTLTDTTDGLVVLSDNFGATSLMTRSLSGKVACIYGDPPYNTEADRESGKFLYKDGFARASWLAMMRDRIARLIPLLADKSVLYLSIDEHELYRLGEVLDQLLPARIGVFTWVKKKKGSHLSKTVRDMTEYVLAHTPQIGGLELFGEAAYGDKAQPIVKKTNSMKSIHLPGRVLRTTLADGTYDAGRKGDSESALEFKKEFKVVDGVVTTSTDIVGRFVWSQEMVDSELTLGSEFLLSREFGINVMRAGQEERVKRPSTLMLDRDAGVGANEDAWNELKDLFGKEGVASYPKPVSLLSNLVDSITHPSASGLVFDPFAGSGTTAHAVLELNRIDSGRRHYALVEMGSFADIVLLPRIKKVVYSREWKDGSPVAREGVSHLMKYIRLESYEDTLNNLELTPRTKVQENLLAGNPRLKEDYLLQYMLDVETAGSASLLNLETFENPFAYKLKVSTGTVGETKEVHVDLVETFNWLLGLRVKTYDVISGYHVIRGKNPDDEEVLVIWRNLKEKSNKDLETFFEKQAYKVRDKELDLIYVNGDNHLENVRRPDETWKVRLIEQELHRLMWDAKDV